MPELPDVTVYLECLAPRLLGQPLLTARLLSPFVLRTADPPLGALTQRPVRALRRLGKRLVFAFDDELFLVLHLMIAGRLRFLPPGAKLPRQRSLAAFDFPTGILLLTEAGTKRRAALHLVRGEAALQGFARGGLDLLAADEGTFREALLRERHTLKRALTDPRLFDGIGNAYSDEILHRARLSPVRLTDQLDDDEIRRLHQACAATLGEWIARLRAETGAGFPEQVTAFREGMAVHGRYGLPCPACGTKVQRIVYAENETNYCPTCQTGGRLLADRGMSRLLHGDWPKTLEELEERKSQRRSPLPPGAPRAKPRR